MIELKNVRMAYGEKQVFGALSLSFPDRGMFAILGPSGRGKTTLLRLIAGLEAPQSGSISMPKDARIAFCFQEDRLLPFKTVLENVLLAVSYSCGPKVSKGRPESPLGSELSAPSGRNSEMKIGTVRERARDHYCSRSGRWGRAPSPERIAIAKHWIDQVGLSGEENAYPASLSGGMKRRASLARALAFDAPILLMDEPFRALDDATHAQMLSLVREAAKDKLLLLVTHDEADACGMQVVRL